GELDAALEPGLYFLHIVLHATQRLDRQVLGDHAAVANETDLAPALDVPVGDEAAGDVADAADLEHLADFRVAVELLALFGREHAAEGFLQIVEDLVDHAIGLDVDVVLLGQRAGGFVGDDVEADHGDLVVGRLGLGRHRQLDVALADRAHAAVDDA